MAWRILLVDDEMHILKAAEFKLKNSGFEVLCADDGEEAWDILQSEHVDLVVTDLQMPNLDGLELIERMRGSEAFSSLPVILLTAKCYELVPTEVAERVRICDVIAKPFSPRELCSRVQAAVEEAERNRSITSAAGSVS